MVRVDLALEFRRIKFIFFNRKPNFIFYFGSMSATSVTGLIGRIGRADNGNVIILEVDLIFHLRNNFARLVSDCQSKII